MGYKRNKRRQEYLKLARNLPRADLEHQYVQMQLTLDDTASAVRALRYEQTKANKQVLLKAARVEKILFKY